MTDISLFKKILEAAANEPVRLPVIWLCAYVMPFRPAPGTWPWRCSAALYSYHLWVGRPTPLFKMSTTSLADARAVAAELAETVIECGPPDAFRKAAK
jgi:hypothetical protein